MPQSLIELQTNRAVAGSVESAFDSPAGEIGDQLKCMFDRLTNGPMPKRLTDLADALEEAFQRGELFDTQACSKRGRPG